MKPLSHLILALLVCVFAFISYGAAYASVTAKSAETASLQSQIDAQTSTVTRLTTTRATLAQIAADESSVQSYFVPQSGIVSFIDSLQGIGRTLGTTIQVQSVATGGTAVKPTLNLVVTIDGTFDGVMRTVGAIEYAPYAISVSRLTVGSLDKGNWEAQMTLTVGSRADAPQNHAATTTP